MDDFFSKKEYTENDINDLIGKSEESINLEFKSNGSLSIDTSERKEKTRMDISKDVSSFANSIGGKIIYGINEKDHVADSLSFIDGSKITKEWIEQVIQSNIQRRIDGLVIIPIRFGNDITKTVYIVKIPASNQAPHMERDNKYYKRQNFESVAMEEYEVRNMYFEYIRQIYQSSA